MRDASAAMRGASRREFLKGSVALGVATSAGAWPRLARAGGGIGNDVLVYVVLRGGIDGLSFCVPYGDGDYYAARPTLAVAPPGLLGGSLDLDGMFGLHPAAAPLLPSFGSGDLAIVHASGSPDPTRSHFLAFQKLELGIPNQPLTAATDGWMARHLANITPAATGPLRCAVLSGVMPQSLAGAPKALPIPDPEEFLFPGTAATSQARKALFRAMHDPFDPPMGEAAIDTLDSIELLQSFALAPPANGAVYSATPLGDNLRRAAGLIKADLGIEMIVLELDGFDHHSNQGVLDGKFAELVDELATSLRAFHLDLLADWNRVTLVAHSEFGRRVAENGGKGTDHGHGGVMLVMGGHVQGGQVFTQWPGLQASQLDEGDLAITTDYRDVVGEVLAKRLGAPNLSAIFPNHNATFPGLIS